MGINTLQRSERALNFFYMFGSGQAIIKNRRTAEYRTAEYRRNVFWQFYKKQSEAIPYFDIHVIDIRYSQF